MENCQKLLKFWKSEENPKSQQIELSKDTSELPIHLLVYDCESWCRFKGRERIRNVDSAETNPVTKVNKQISSTESLRGILLY